MLDENTRARGQEVRRKVLGETHVKGAHATADEDPLYRPKQQLAEYVWGKVWARPGISLKSRSMINLAMLTALNRPEELRLHVRGALNNGLTKDEIREVLLQTGMYCGVPAARDSFRVAQEVFRELGV